MNTQVQLLNERLVAMQATVRGIFPGSNPNATKEQIAAEINKALDQLEAGEYEEVKI